MVPHFSFWTIPLSFPDKKLIIFRLPTNNDGKDMFWEFVSFLKHCYGHVESTSDIPAKAIGKRPKTFCSLFQIGENFYLFLILPFYSKCFCIYEECQARQTVSAQWPEFIPQKTKKNGKTFWKRLFLKMFPWTVRKQFENPADFFWLPASRSFPARYLIKNSL